jgi:uncharacterized protein YodC (DUF2158 family)
MCSRRILYSPDGSATDDKTLHFADLIEEVPAPNMEKHMGGGGAAGTFSSKFVFVDWGATGGSYSIQAASTRPFVVGDLVTLKSGGPKMTIVRSNGATTWVCAYSEDAKIIHRTFPPAALVHAK